MPDTELEVEIRPSESEAAPPQLVTAFSEFMGESILPPSNNVFDEVNYSDFKKEHPIRFHIWEELRGLRNDYSAETQQRLKRLGKYLHILNSLDRYTTTHNENKLAGEETLYDEQFDVFQSIRDGLELGETSGYVKLPTGTGKTVLFTEFIEAMGLTTARGEGIKSLIVVPTTIPIGQTEEALSKFAADIPYGKVYGEQKDIGKKEKPVTIITDESLAIQIAKGELDPDSYDLVIFDEAHNYLSENKKALISENFANAIKMGFTATPHYSEEKSVASILPYEYASMPVTEAVKKGMLSDVITMYARCGIDIQGVRIDGSEYSEDDLEKTIDIKQVNDKFADFYKQNFSEETGIISCVGITHATHMAESLREQGLAAEVIHGYMSDKEKEDLTNKHGNGEIQVLCFDKILAESYDQPGASVCLNLRPTMSIVMAEQRAGRVLRLDSNSPNKIAKVIDVIYSSRGNPNRQVLYPEILGGARIFGEVGNGKSGTSLNSQPTISEVVSVEGLEITIDQEEIMRISNERMKNNIDDRQGWAFIGEPYMDGSLCQRYGINPKTIEKYIDQAIALLETNFRNENIEGNWRLESKKYLDTFRGIKGANKPTIHYSPALIHKLDLLIPPKAPENWVIAGDTREKNGLGQKYSMTNKSVIKYIDLALENIRQSYLQENPNGIWEEEKQKYTGVFRSITSGQVLKHFSPELVEELDVLIPPIAPEGWLVTGTSKMHEGTLCRKFEIGSSPLPKYIAKSLEILKNEFLASSPNGNWNRKKETYTRIFRTRESGKVVPYFSPLLIEVMEKVIPPKGPDGWMICGNAKLKGTIGAKFQMTSDTLDGYITTALQATKQVYVEAYPDSNWDNEKYKYCGEYRGKTGISMHYSPEIVQLLEAIIPPYPPAGWETTAKLGSHISRGIEGRFSFDPRTLQKYIDRTMNLLQGKFLEKSPHNNWEEEKKKYSGTYRSPDSKAQTYYSNEFIEELSVVIENSK